MKILKLIIIATLLLSCKANKKEDKPDDSVVDNSIYNWNDTLKGAQQIEGDQWRRGEDVCLALQDKRAFLQSRGDRNLSLVFDRQERNCSGSTESLAKATAILRIQSSNNIYLEPSRGISKFISETWTDQSAKIKSICESILRGEEPSNHVADGSLKYQINFLKDNVSSSVILQIVEFRNVNGAYRPYLIDQSRIMKRGSRNSDLSGFSVKRLQARPCANRSSLIFEQTLN